MKKILTLLLVVSAFCAKAQETWPVNGTVEKDLTTYALTNAVIHVSAEEVIEGTLVFTQGRILGTYPKDAELPKMANTVTIDLEGYHVYPSFIDLWTDYGMPDTPKAKRERGPQFTSDKKGAFGWNEAIKPEIRGAELFSHENGKADGWTSAGYGAVLTHQHDGIARGTATLVALGENDNTSLLIPNAAATYSFRKGSSSQDYPNSLMGAIALLRQTYYDARWYASAPERRESNLSLEAWIDNQDLPQLFSTRDRLDVLRADKIGDEFGIQYLFQGNGDEYQRLDEMKATGGAFIVPLDFPQAYDVSDPYLARFIGLDELKHWEMAPKNPAFLEYAEIPFAVTASGLKSPGMVLDRMRTAIAHGLSEETALRAMTETPAALVNAGDLVGQLKEGMLANFIVTDGKLFDKGTKLYENWVLGEPNVLIDRNAIDLRGQYALTFNDRDLDLKVEGETGKYSAKFTVITEGEEGADTLAVKVKLNQDAEQITLTFGPQENIFDGVYRLTGNVFSGSRIWRGKGETPDGDWFEWAAVKEEEVEKGKGPEPTPVDSLNVDSLLIPRPFIAYGRTAQPERETLLITNATLWTCEEDGVIEKGQLLLHDGKIMAVGKKIDLEALFGRNIPEIERWDVKGAHVTPGIIDEHSHIAISRGVNEATQTSSAEVSIATVVDSEDIDIYRQLSGGVTASQLLHGSANAIGGQSGLIKLRWGLTPDEMLIEDAPGFIKFALGENVKQSNWGPDNTERFPQTRMGVEQVFYDHFIRAREYGEEWAAYESEVENLSRRQRRRGDLPVAPRRDLELEALLEILNRERFVTCHSYRQDEINMLMHVADSMGFTLNTFTHILEGYKLADKLAAHGAGGSSFSDWWAYKFEVKDAIPHNGAILWEQGVVTAFNSDDAEMARRLNQEAAKAVKYGGVPEAEALKFVTLNPAKLLHLDHRMGSLKAGKDGDIVIWTDHPLSVYAKSRATFVDGRRYYDREEDEATRKALRKERARLVQKMLDSGGEGAKRKPTEKTPHHYHCDTVTDEIR
jgi:imidazolonepropionase-like amidohydrolase